MKFSFHLVAIALIVSLIAPVVAPSFVHAQTAGNAVQECTVDAVLDALGGEILDAAGDVLTGIGDFFTGGLFGDVVDSGPQEVKEVGEQGKEIKKLQFDTCVKAIKDAALKVALAKLKKRLLDRMTDDIIAWISDGRDPKFITNFGDYLEDAAQAAVGDTARALGLAELCTPFRYRLPPLLTPVPKFSESVTCTLDDIVENIEGFYEDFERGGWLAYAESWKPNNNPVGILLATQDQVLKETAKKKEEAQLAATAGGGYKPIEQCLEWTLTGFNRTSNEYFASIIPADDSFPYLHPYLPPGPGSAPYENALNTLRNPQYNCTRKEITLPPAGTQQIASVALTADTQVVANSDDLSPYVNAIFDAAVNRIIKEGVKALRGNPSNLRSESGTGRPPEEYGDDDRYRGYGEEYENATNFTAQLRAELQTKISETRNDIAAASTTLTRLITLNTQITASTTALFDCQTTKFGSACANTSSSLTAANLRKSQFDSGRAALTQARSGIEEIANALAADPNMSEGALRALLATLGSVRLSLQTTIAQQEALETLIQGELDVVGEELRACGTPSYSCSWTPSSP